MLSCFAALFGLLRSANSPPPPAAEGSAAEGTAGAIVLSAGGALAIKSGGAAKHWNAKPAAAPWMSAPWETVQDSVVRTSQHFVDALRAGREPDTSGFDNLRTLAAVEAAYQAAEQGAAVTPQAVAGGAPQ